MHPLSVFFLTERLELNPDVYFNSFYDYYYAGGNLDCFEKSNEENVHLMHVGGENLTKLSMFCNFQFPNLITLIFV